MAGADSVAVELRRLSLRLGAFSLDNVDLVVETGGYTVILGPTGGGKTVLLETIIGFHRPDSGDVCIGGKSVVDLPPEYRMIGYVPQDYSLFPNMTVSENIAFGPKVRGWSRKAVSDRVSELCSMLGIEHLAGRLPARLSGGEKQRVAIGRALAVKPTVVILDEPLSALDESRRDELALELKRIQQTVGGTFIHVCHDFDEAAQVADKVAVVSDGRIMQVGTISDLLYRPASRFVARFSGAANVFDVESVTCSGGLACLRLRDGGRLHVAKVPESVDAAVVRPESIRLLSVGDGGDDVLGAGITGLQCDNPDSSQPAGGDVAEGNDGTLPVPPGSNVFMGSIESRAGRALNIELTVRVVDTGSVWKISIPREPFERGPEPGKMCLFQVPPDKVWTIGPR